MFTILSFLLAIITLVFIHEYGHYFAAKKFKVKIEEFSIGFGKTLYSYLDSKEVLWKISLIPLGGYVKMYGDTNPATIGSIKTLAEPDKAFVNKPPYARFIIIAAGPIANFLFALVILSCFYFAYGLKEIPPVVNEVIQNSPAQKAGLQKNDKIIEADDEKIENFIKLQRIILINPHRIINLLVNRNEELIKIKIIPELKKDNKTEEMISYIGVIAQDKFIYTKLGLISSVNHAAKEIIIISKLTLKALTQVIIGQRSSEIIHGPLTIASESSKALSNGILDYILMLAALSINLGLINLFPIPILDGGHLVLIIYEVLRKKPLSANSQNILLRIGLMIITFLIVISVSNDIKTLLF